MTDSLALIGLRMRAAQKRHEADRTDMNLRAAKALERQFDQACEAAIGKKPRRKAIPIALQFIIVERQDGRCAADGCGKRLVRVYSDFWIILAITEFDHRPPLALRPINDAGTDYEPPQLHPAYIDALCKDCHDKRTNKGRSGSTSLGSDKHAIAKVRRLRGETKKRPKRAIRSRGFRKDISKGFDGKIRKRDHPHHNRRRT